MGAPPIKRSPPPEPESAHGKWGDRSACEAEKSRLSRLRVHSIEGVLVAPR